MVLLLLPVSSLSSSAASKYSSESLNGWEARLYVLNCTLTGDEPLFLQNIIVYDYIKLDAYNVS